MLTTSTFFQLVPHTPSGDPFYLVYTNCSLTSAITTNSVNDVLWIIRTTEFCHSAGLTSALYGSPKHGKCLVCSTTNLTVSIHVQ